MKQQASFSIKYRYYRFIPFKSLLLGIIKKRIDSIVDPSIDFIENGDNILDIGAGTGWVAEEIKKRKKTNATLLDVTDFNQTDLKLVLYEGKIMPFEDNSFDVVFINFVLHHTDNPIEVLKEAKRVSRRNVIIFEDTYTSGTGYFFLCLWDYISNLPSFLVAPFTEKMPFNFKTVTDWRNVFYNLDLKIISEKEYRGNIAKHVLFVLKKSK